MKRLFRRMIAWAVSKNWLWAVLRGTVVRASNLVSSERRKFERGTIPEPRVNPVKVIKEMSPDQTVLHGPFKGLRYKKIKAIGSALVPKILGSYERELHPFLERVATDAYTDIVNVGCAEGYYAVGMALRFPGAKVYAFDIQEEARRLCGEMAALNGVSERVILKEACDPAALIGLPYEGRALIVSDCEGYEKELFTKEVAQAMAQHDFIVETHDFWKIEISPTIKAAFADTHDIEVVSSLDDIVKAQTYDYPELAQYDLLRRKMLVREGRPAIQDWLLMTPKVEKS